MALNTTPPHSDDRASDIRVVANAVARTALTGYVGMHVIEADTKREWVWDGAAWQVTAEAGGWRSYAPAARANANAVTGVGTDCLYSQIGKTIHATGYLDITSTAPLGVLAVSLPVVSRAFNTNRPFGTALYYDASSGTISVGFVFYDNTNEVRIRNATGVAFSSDLAPGDVISWQVTYLAA